MKNFDPHKYSNIYYHLLINSKDKNNNDKAANNNNNCSYFLLEILHLCAIKMKYCSVPLYLLHSTDDEEIDLVKEACPKLFQTLHRQKQLSLT